MKIEIKPSRVCGSVAAPPSKSHVHRLLIAAALAVFFRTDDLGFVVLCVLLAGLIIYRHRGNIVRLVHGTESKLGRRKR